MFSSLSIDKKRGAIITFVGGGGKTSTMFKLANYLKDFGSVLVTTTTKIFIPSSDKYDSFINLLSGDKLVGREGITLLANGINSDNKIIGVKPCDIDSIYDRGMFKFILVEADGAKSMPIKAPNQGEPIIPSKTSINIGVIGVDAIGKDIDTVCFRSSVFKENILKCKHIDEEAIISLINSPRGLYKATPNGCRKYLIINKCDGLEEKNLAKNLLLHIRRETDINKTFISSMVNNEFIHEGENILGIIMASGFSRRMGQNKLLMKVLETSMIRRVTLEASSSMLSKVVLVYRDELVLEEVSDLAIESKLNLNSNEGQSASIREGLNIDNNNYNGYMFFVGDQPFIESSIINSIIKSFNINKDCITIPYYNGKKGNPVVFPSYLKNALKSISGDNGGKKVIQECEKINKVHIEDEIRGIDVDTIEEYRSFGGK
ncbi:MAG: selenium cofactor biosynthesis protein YqeC [Clostridium sp.]